MVRQAGTLICRACAVRGGGNSVGEGRRNQARLVGKMGKLADAENKSWRVDNGPRQPTRQGQNIRHSVFMSVWKGCV